MELYLVKYVVCYKGGNIEECKKRYRAKKAETAEKLFERNVKAPMEKKSDVAAVRLVEITQMDTGGNVNIRPRRRSAWRVIAVQGR